MIVDLYHPRPTPFSRATPILAYGFGESPLSELPELSTPVAAIWLPNEPFVDEIINGDGIPVAQLRAIGCVADDTGHLVIEMGRGPAACWVTVDVYDKRDAPLLDHLRFHGRLVVALEGSMANASRGELVLGRTLGFDFNITEIAARVAEARRAAG